MDTCLRQSPHHIVITKRLERPSRPFTRCNVDWVRTDIFARLDREPEPPKIEIPRMSRTRATLFGGTLAFYNS